MMKPTDLKLMRSLVVVNNVDQPDGCETLKVSYGRHF